MKVFLGGARGSFPGAGPDQARYGGDTFALLAEGVDGAQVLVDAGTGLQRLMPRVRPGGTLFFTHTHLDHLIGLPLLQAAWPARLILPRGDLPEVLARVFAPPVWPVKLPAADCAVPAAPVVIGGLRVSWQPVAHPDGCVAYRIDEPATGAGVVVATDIEWPAMTPRAQDAFAAFARGTDLLVFDAQYRPEEFPARQGWGHSAWTDAVEAARRCGAVKLWLMHHAPGRTDAEIDGLAAEASARFPGARVPTESICMETLHE
jgi:ribonuclease BN (tRNA processing enzyme)